MTQAFRRTYSFSECASFRAWRKYPAAIANSTHIELWAAPSSQMSRQVIAGLWPSMRRMPNVSCWHEARAQPGAFESTQSAALPTVKPERQVTLTTCDAPRYSAFEECSRVP